MPTLTAWPVLSWVYDPCTYARRGLAHATCPGSRVALCGADTPYLGPAWPTIDELWLSQYGRCPSCARRVYAGRF